MPSISITRDPKSGYRNHAWGIKLKSKDPLDIVTQSISIGPGGSTGWHSQPGPVFVTIRAGALKIVYAIDRHDRLCVGTTYTAGQSFVDRGDQHVHNASSVRRCAAKDDRPETPGRVRNTVSTTRAAVGSVP